MSSKDRLKDLRGRLRNTNNASVSVLEGQATENGKFLYLVGTPS